MSKKKMTMGLIVGNRGFFPDHLAKDGREEMLRRPASRRNRGRRTYPGRE